MIGIFILGFILGILFVTAMFLMTGKDKTDDKPIKEKQINPFSEHNKECSKRCYLNGGSYFDVDGYTKCRCRK